jgi:hypothetical protein
MLCQDRTRFEPRCMRTTDEATAALTRV